MSPQTLSLDTSRTSLSDVTLLKHDLDGLFLDESDRRMQDTDQSPYQQQLSVSVGVLAKVEVWMRSFSSAS